MVHEVKNTCKECLPFSCITCVIAAAETLFREESVAVKLITAFMYDTEGLRFLRNIFDPLFTQLYAFPQGLEVGIYLFGGLFVCFFCFFSFRYQLVR